MQIINHLLLVRSIFSKILLPFRLIKETVDALNKRKGDLKEQLAKSNKDLERTLGELR